MLSGSESDISVRSPKNMLVRFSRDAPVDYIYIYFLLLYTMISFLLLYYLIDVV